MYISDLGAQPSVSLTMATDGSEDDDILSGRFRALERAVEKESHTTT